MALDEALMTRARDTGEWVLRVYSWATGTVSFGRNQTARGRYDVERIKSSGLDVVRRPTGGRAILHDREVTYSVTAPVDGAGDLRESYERINRLLVASLATLGVSVAVAAPRERAPVPDAAPCFEQPTAGELTVGGQKLAGSAQWRSDGALLQHGSILVDDDQGRLGELVIPARAVARAPATLSAVLGWTPAVGDLADALRGAVRGLEDPGVSVLEVEDSVRARAEALVVRYADDGWTWRR